MLIAELVKCQRRLRAHCALSLDWNHGRRGREPTGNGGDRRRRGAWAGSGRPGARGDRRRRGRRREGRSGDGHAGKTGRRRVVHLPWLGVRLAYLQQCSPGPPAIALGYHRRGCRMLSRHESRDDTEYEKDSGQHAECAPTRDRDSQKRAPAKGMRVFSLGGDGDELTAILPRI